MPACKPGCKCGKHNKLRITNIEGIYQCKGCGEWKDTPEWHYSKTGRSSRCKTCHAEEGRQRRLKTLFNISTQEYDKILKQQNGRCAICLTLPGKTRLAVDHDHRTGLVRGLLCWHCNSALGKFNDSLVRVQRAADYVTNPPATKALGEDRFGRKGRVTTKTRKRKKRKV